MPILRTAPIALAAALLLASAAQAQEVVKTGPEGAPPAAEAAPPMPLGGDPTDDQSPEAIGAWGRAVLAGQPTGPSRATEQRAEGGSRGCAPTDGKPHGEVWAGAGTRGYREAGGVVTAPIGKCGSVTIAIDKTEFGGRRR